MRVLFTFCALWLGCVSLSAGTDEWKVVCYFGSWATYRTGNGSIAISDIDPTLCTHMIYTFVGLTEEGEVTILDPWNDLTDDGGKGGFQKFNNLRNRSPTTKTMAAIGGWNEGSERYSDVIGNSTLRSTLVTSIVNFLTRYGFEGFDIDWEYPNQRNGTAVDVQNFVLFLQELRESFDEHEFILSVAVAAAESSASRSYDIPNIAKYVDFINLMTYDFHLPLEFVLGHNAPLYPSSRETTASERQLSIDAAVRYWIGQGAPAEKLILGTPFYGHVFARGNSTETEPGSPADGAGEAGPYTQEAGTLSYLEICQLLDEGGWTTVWDEEQRVPYAYKGDQWISYDDVRSITEKTEYTKTVGLGGVMMWSFESDDVHGIYGSQFPLLTAINLALHNDGSAGVRTSVSTTTTTYASNSLSWSEEDSNTICSGGSKYVRDSNDCSKFWVCQQISSNNFTATTFFCADDLYFDVTRNVCNYADDVKC